MVRRRTTWITWRLLSFFALTLVALVALGRGIRAKLGGIEIATQQDSIAESKKKFRRLSHSKPDRPLL